MWTTENRPRYNRDKPGNGFVPLDDVVGRAVLITWPIDRWTYLTDYPMTFAGVGSPSADKTPAASTPTPMPSSR